MEVTNTTFNPFTQSMLLRTPSNNATIAVPLATLYEYIHTGAASSIIFGVQVGVCFIFLLVMAVMTRPDRRRSAIFLLNFAAVFMLLINGILMCITLTGANFNFYSLVTNFYKDSPKEAVLTSIATVTHFLAEVALELSMLFQVHVVCCTMVPYKRRIMLAVSGLVALADCSTSFTEIVVSIDCEIVNINTAGRASFALVQKLGATHNFIFVVSIYYFCGIFCAKLGHAIWQRRKTAVKRFSAIHIIFIMSFQTLIIPATFGVLAFFVLKSARLQALMFVTLAAFVPLSGMWATANAAEAKFAPVYRPYSRQPVAKSGSASTNLTFSGERRSAATRQPTCSCQLLSLPRISVSLDSIDLEKIAAEVHDELGERK